ncbi:GntR family transcriptional regulator [Lysobacter sp. H21R4]|uniref:GntR family transcriptional regulator n=1 Tax=Lysobacter sp. H21R4 TaxID=2781021 RepID=UPI00188825A0|nr:GntR family transcriptional regulator [Lysobacter sp. H21R4]QOY62703.1 GntR family transcriptional regulator [Lysobacter sp. H21R4]
MTGQVVHSLQSPDLRQLLRPDLPLPLYHQIFNILRERVLAGDPPHGAQLPTEFGLAETFGVSRITAKRALDELANAGLVERQRGRGTHVIHRASPKPVRGPLIGLLENLHILAEETEAKVVEFGRVAPPPRVRELFALEPGEPLARAVRVRSRAGTPFGHYTSWTLTGHGEFNEHNLATTSRLKLFERIGIQIRQVQQTLSAVNADAVVAMHLGMDPGSALLALERHSFDESGRLVDLLNILYRPDQFSYQMTLDLDEPSGAR